MKTFTDCFSSRGIGRIVLGVLIVCSFLGLMAFYHSSVSVERAAQYVPLICPIKTVTDISCPGCGMTRSFLALAKGDVLLAWQYNPLSIFLVCLFAFSILKLNQFLAPRITQYFYMIALLVIIFWWGCTRLWPRLMF